MSTAAPTDIPDTSSLRSVISGRWQVPLLVGSVLVLGSAVARIASEHHPRSYGEQLELVARLRSADALGRASAFLMDLLKDRGWTKAERGGLQRLLAATVHQAESRLGHHRRENTQAIISNYRGAQRAGTRLESEDWIALGDSYVWAGDPSEAIASYREALHASASAPARVRRAMVELQSAREGKLGEEARKNLGAMLKDGSTPPADYLWACEQVVRSSLEGNDATSAIQAASAARERLAGMEEASAVTFLEALVQWKTGLAETAQESLIGLRRDRQARDELWAKSSWLLGKLEQEDDRPQAALSHYEDVLASHFTGPIHNACLLGRAECLAVLERYDAALEVFTQLNAAWAGAEGASCADRASARATVDALGQALFRGGRASEGVGFTRLALEWTDPADSLARRGLLAGLCENLEAIARDASKDRVATDSAWAEAAEIQMSLARMADGDEEAVARAVERAADDFVAAGLPSRLIQSLNWYAAMHPSGIWRCPALHRLGEAYQREARFDEAIDSYREVVRLCSRLPDAAECLVPLAECLMKSGGRGERAGVEVLLDIVDDRITGMVFSPRMPPFRDAMFLLGEYYSRSTDRSGLERAIVRLEDAVAFYPDDPRLERARFLLAEAYRQSADLLREEAVTSTRAEDREGARAEGQRRCANALDGYSHVIAGLSGPNPASLTAFEATMLRASFLSRGDCLFELGRLPDAVAAYREAVWRYENTPTAVTASMQIVHAHLRLGQTAEAAAALARLRWLLAKMPERAFAAIEGGQPRDYWRNLIAQLERTGLN